MLYLQPQRWRGFLIVTANNPMKKTIVFCFASMFLTFAHAAIDQFDWQSYIDTSCKPTLTGSAKRLLGETSFWAHVNVSMDWWAREMDSEKPQEVCYSRYQAANQTEKLMQCLAYIQDKWAWYARCKPVAVQLCRQSGGSC